MKLSELKTGEVGVIAKVNGHGGFRKRLIERGFISGKRVAVVLNAPLKDPIEYEILGYKVSLRRSEAGLILKKMSPPVAANPAKVGKIVLYT